MNTIVLMPVLVCLTVALINLVLWQYRRLQRVCHIIGAVLLLFVTGYVFSVVMSNGILVCQIGDYQAPFGISFVVDILSAIMLFITAIISFCVAIYALIDVTLWRQRSGFYFAYWMLLLGICGSFSTGDIFNLYVWFEVMLIASFILLVMGNKKVQLDGAMKYVSMNLVATIIMLLAIAMLYAMTGTLNMADLAVKLKISSMPGTVTTVVLLLTIAFGVKAAIFPFFFWLPASYHTANVSTAAIFAGMLTKVGVYALIRVTTLILPNSHEILSLLLLAAGLTMLTGVLGAVSQFHFRRLLSFHIISQIGYMVMGLAIYTPLALAGCIFYIVHHILVKTNLFLISGVCYRLGKSSDISRLGNFYQHYPFLSILFFIPAFSLAGVPPLSGFWGKLILLESALKSSHYIIAMVSLFVSLLTLYSMTKIWNQVFWKQHGDQVKHYESLSRLNQCVLYFPIILLTILTITIGLFPQTLMMVMLKSADQLSHPEWYIKAVLGV